MKQTVGKRRKIAKPKDWKKNVPFHNKHKNIHSKWVKTRIYSKYREVKVNSLTYSSVRNLGWSCGSGPLNCRRGQRPVSCPYLWCHFIARRTTTTWWQISHTEYSLMKLLNKIYFGKIKCFFGANAIYSILYNCYHKWQGHYFNNPPSV